jgi:hypothetical protein
MAPTAARRRELILDDRFADEPYPMVGATPTGTLEPEEPVHAFTAADLDEAPSDAALEFLATPPEEVHVDQGLRAIVVATFVAVVVIAAGLTWTVWQLLQTNPWTIDQ